MSNKRKFFVFLAVYLGIPAFFGSLMWSFGEYPRATAAGLFVLLWTVFCAVAVWCKGE